MTGLEASREIRAFEREHRLPSVTIIALTALASEEVQKEAFASGIDLFLTKPVRLKELGEIVAKSRERRPDSSA
jgi:CheY-like chemotaxis protein